MKNKIALTLIDFLANFVMAESAGQLGMLIEPIVVRYDADANTVASISSLLDGGVLTGTIIAFLLIEKIGVKRMTLIIYSIVLLCALVMYSSPGLWPVMVAMTLVGFCDGIGLCVAGTIAVLVWQDCIQGMMLVVQNATLNVAGVVFSLVVAFALAHNMSWSYSHLNVGMVALLTLGAVTLTRFATCETAPVADRVDKIKSEWNPGTTSGGTGLFLGMLALYTFLIWTSLFMKNEFDILFGETGNIITQHWGAALAGVLVPTVIVSRVRIYYFLLGIILLANIITTIIVTKDNIFGSDYLTYSYGFICTALYDLFIAYSVSFVKRTSSQNVSYILIGDSAGATLNSAISAFIERTMGLQKVMYAISVLYLIVFVMLMMTLKLKRN